MRIRQFEKMPETFPPLATYLCSYLCSS